LRIPYPIIFVLIGLLAGVLNVLPERAIGPEFIMFVFIPPLLFEAAWNLDFDELRRSWLAVPLLATIGVIISMAVAAFLLVAWRQLDWAPALVFGAIIAATDPVSVVAVFRKLGVDHRLTALLEGESLFNDGTAVALFAVVLANVLAPTSIPLTEIAMRFVGTICGGIAAGIAIGWVAEQLARRLKHDGLEILLTVIVSYASFFLAEKIHVSPVLSVVAAGMLMGTCGKRDITKKIWIEVDTFWSMVALCVNCIVFFLIGLEARVHSVLAESAFVFMGIAATLVSRLAVVVPLCSLASLAHERISLRWQTLIYWGGLRGALSMVMALSLPANMPHRHDLVVLTFGVVLFTLLVQGLTIEPLIALLGIKSHAAEPPEEAEQSHPSE
jgi:CPA1 family monovalent cation:H+ antiporter